MFVAFSACLLAFRNQKGSAPFSHGSIGSVEVETVGPRRDMAGSQKIDDT